MKRFPVAAAPVERVYFSIEKAAPSTGPVVTAA
jgi:hypothetical protein